MDKGAPRLAVPVFRSRVAPVLNWCSKIHVFPEEEVEPAVGQEIVLLNMGAFDRLRILQEEGVRTLICGALSPDLLNYGEGLGLRIIHGVAGEVEDVLEAYRARELHLPRFRLPGCCGPRRCESSRAGSCTGRAPGEGGTIGREGEEPGRGESTAPASPEARTMGNGRAGPGGFCKCPRCGSKVRHERGIPCSQIVCPHCEQPMVRR